MINQNLKPLLMRLEVPLALFYFFYFALVGVYIIFMPKTLLSFDYTMTEVGIIYAAAPMMRFLIPFLFRRFIVLDHKVFLYSLGFIAISAWIFLYTIENFWLFFVANILFGAAMGITLPFVETISLHQLSRSRYGRVRLYGSIGFALIALWLGKVLSHPYETPYYLIAIGFMIIIFGTLVSYLDDATTLETTQENRDFKLMLYPWFWLSIFLTQVGFGGFYNFFTIYEMAHGTSLELTSWMWSFGVVCEIVMLYFQGPLLQKNLLNILMITLLITVFRWLLLYLYANSIVITFVSQSLHAASFALYHTASISYVFMLYTQKRLAQQFFLGIAFGLGGSVGAMLAGVVYGESMFLIEAIITLFAFAALYLHSKRVASQKNSDLQSAVAK